LRAEGTFRLEANSSTCVRVAEGDVHVAVPLVGRKVEAAIISGLAEHAEAEAEVLQEWLTTTKRPDGH
jgi:hypothetical protein